MGNPSRFDDFDRLEFLIDHPHLTVLRDKATLRWFVDDREARRPVSRRHDSAREAIDYAMELQHGRRAP